MQVKPFLVFTCCCVLAGCSTADRLSGRGPIVDMAGVDEGQYQADLQDCQAYADEVQVGQQTAAGAAAGAVVGGVIGAVVGNSDTAERAAGVGAASGGLSGASQGMNERQVVVKNCLRGRGYRVLN